MGVSSILIVLCSPPCNLYSNAHFYVILAAHVLEVRHVFCKSDYTVRDISLEQKYLHIISTSFPGKKINKTLVGSMDGVEKKLSPN